MLGLKEHLDPNHGYHPYLKETLNTFDLLKADSIPNYTFPNCPNDFVDTVAIDPRCPKHKAQFMKNWFESKGIQVVKSNCFGYLPDTFEVYPEE